MKIHTTRFGSIEIEPDDILFFRNGLIGFEDCRHWVLLGRRCEYISGLAAKHATFRCCHASRFSKKLCCRLPGSGWILWTWICCSFQRSNRLSFCLLSVATRKRLTLNLRAPLVINLDRRIGSQIITVDEQPMQYELATLADSVASQRLAVGQGCSG